MQHQRFSAALTTGTTACSIAALTTGTTACSTAALTTGTTACSTAALTTGTTAFSIAALTTGTTACSAVPTFLCSTDYINNSVQYQSLSAALTIGTIFLHTVDCTSSLQKQYSPPPLAPSFGGCYHTHSNHPSTPPHAFFLFIVNVPAPPTLSRPQKQWSEY